MVKDLKIHNHTDAFNDLLMDLLNLDEDLKYEKKTF